MRRKNGKRVSGKYVHELLALVNGSPFPAHLPFRLVSIGLGEARVELEVEQNHLQPLGTVHGGVIATLIDTATYWAAFLALPEDTGLVNVDLKLNYLRPVDQGQLVADGRCLRAGRTLSYAESHVRDGDGRLVAHGTSTLMALPGNPLAVGVQKFIDE
jgi:uncharacterized protein (TIGR00369 family)